MSLASPYEESYPPSLWAPPGPPGPDPGSASPGDVFPAEPTITAEDATNAAKLAGLGYVADPTTAWLPGEGITVGTFDFSWSGTAWAAGVAPQSVPPATGVTAGPWLTDEYVVIGTGNAHWTGTDWAMGKAP